MSILDKLNPITSILTGAKEIIGAFKLPPDQEMQARLAFANLEIQAEREQRQFELELERTTTADLANLREQIKTEIHSEDAFVRRARPAWLYALLAIYLINYAIIPIINLWHQIAQFQVPSEVHLLTGGSFLGYSWLRSRYDKNGAGNIPK